MDIAGLIKNALGIVLAWFGWKTNPWRIAGVEAKEESEAAGETRKAIKGRDVSKLNEDYRGLHN